MILKTLATVVAVVVIGLSVLWVRSITRDECISWASERVTADLTMISHDYKVGWGPRGLRFIVWYDSDRVEDWAREFVRPKYSSGFECESARYSEDFFVGIAGKEFLEPIRILVRQARVSLGQRGTQAALVGGGSLLVCDLHWVCLLESDLMEVQ